MNAKRRADATQALAEAVVKNIKVLSTMYKVKAEDLAEAAEITTQTYNLHLRHPEAFRLCELAGIANALGVTVADLLSQELVSIKRKTRGAD